MDVVRTSVQGWLSPAPGSLGWGPIVARLPSFGQVPPSTLPDFFLAKLMPRLPTRPPRRIPLVTPTLLSSLRLSVPRWGGQSCFSTSPGLALCSTGAHSAWQPGVPCQGPPRGGSPCTHASSGQATLLYPQPLPSTHRCALHINSLNIRPQV